MTDKPAANENCVLRAVVTNPPKDCKRCGATESLKWHGFVCLACHRIECNARSKMDYAKNPKKWKARSRQYAIDHADKISVARAERCDTNGRFKLSDADVNEIRLRLNLGETQRTVAAAYGISEPTVSRIKTKARHGKL